MSREVVENEWRSIKALGQPSDKARVEEFDASGKNLWTINSPRPFIMKVRR